MSPPDDMALRALSDAPGEEPFTIAELRARMAALIERGETDHAREYGDHLLNPDIVQLIEGRDTREAAVLVPVVEPRRAGQGPSVILTRRSSGLRKHSGQIALPGGSVDPGDRTAEDAALRESAEEIGLDRRFVEPIGRLPRYLTMTGFRITPVVAVVHRGFALEPNPAEVEEIFEVPFAFLMHEANHRLESKVWNGIERHYYVMPFGDRFIWGVTAGILRTFYERLYA